MIRAKPLTLAQKLKNIVDICEEARTAIDGQLEIIKGALDAGKENDGIEPAVVRKILARRKRIAKDPAETARLEDLMTDYQFMLGEGREDTRPWTQTDDEISRVMALTNTGRPPKIEAIKKAIGCSQGKAHKLRSIVAVRLAKKSSSSSTSRELEHLNDGQPDRDSATAAGDETVAPATPGPQDPTAEDDLGEWVPSTRAKNAQVVASVWHFITAPVLEQIAEKERAKAAKEAERERQRAERRALIEQNRIIDADPLTFPSFLDKRRRLSVSA